jgi:outer membrane protein
MRAKSWSGIAPGALILATLLASSPALADTLRDALAQAYNGNPTLQAARARLRQTDENVPIAKADGRLGVSADGAYSENVKRSSQSLGLGPRRQVTAGVNADLPLFQGGAVRNAVRAARERVDAGRADLRGAESQMFTDVVAAYMDVIRDQAIVELNAKQVDVLGTNLQASQDRFEVGDLTRTDVAQSEARRSLAMGQLQAAQAQLVASRENYLRVVGKNPENLEPPPALPGLPETVDAALEVALANNPDLVAIRKESDASRHDVGVARASRLPRVSAVAGGNYIDYLNSTDPLSGFGEHDKSASVGVQVTLPLYQGGGPGARVRQAEARVSETLEQTIEVERQVIAQVRSAYASHNASLGVIRSSQTAVNANQLALEGVRAENGVGTRDVLDVLNAEQELLNASVQLVTARRDAYVAGFAVLAAMGRAEAKDLGLDGGALYDPVANYNRVKTSLFDWSDDGMPTTKATRTVGIPPLPSEALQPQLPFEPVETAPVTTSKN